MLDWLTCQGEIPVMHAQFRRGKNGSMMSKWRYACSRNYSNTSRKWVISTIWKYLKYLNVRRRFDDLLHQGSTISEGYLQPNTTHGYMMVTKCQRSMSLRQSAWLECFDIVSFTELWSSAADQGKGPPFYWTVWDAKWAVVNNSRARRYTSTGVRCGWLVREDRAVRMAPSGVEFSSGHIMESSIHCHRY